MEGKEVLAGNQNAIALAKNPEFHQRTKHIRIKYHFTRKAIQNGDLIVNHVLTKRDG
jgi:hypothetical protein